jgi:hypothetical protein
LKALFDGMKMEVSLLKRKEEPTQLNPPGARAENGQTAPLAGAPATALIAFTFGAP